MSQENTQYPPVPPDDLRRPLTVASASDHDSARELAYIGLVGDTYTILVTGKDTAGRFCLFDMLIPPGGGPGPHRHDFEETFILVEGELEATFRGQRSTVRAGQTISVPANAPHQFHNASSTAARMYCICSPAGQEEFFTRVGVPVSGPDAVPPRLNEEQMRSFLAKAAELAPQYRTELLKQA